MENTKPSTLSNIARPQPRRRNANAHVRLVRKSQSPKRWIKEDNGSSASSMQVDAASDILEEPTPMKESSGGSSDPEKWFEKSNNNINTGDFSFPDGGFFVHDLQIMTLTL
jgi:hypothetical protein